MEKLLAKTLVMNIKLNTIFIVLFRKIYRLNNIAKVINKYMKFIAFSKVNRKKERVIKAKLAINLLETMIKQHATDNIKKIINKFNKNRLKRLGAERLFRYASTKYESYAKSLI